MGNLFGIKLSGRLIHDCMNSTSVDSIIFAETEAELEGTSAIASEVQPLSQPAKEPVLPEQSFGSGHWDVAGHNLDDTGKIALRGSLNYGVGAFAVLNSSNCPQRSPAVRIIQFCQTG